MKFNVFPSKREEALEALKKYIEDNFAPNFDDGGEPWIFEEPGKLPKWGRLGCNIPNGPGVFVEFQMNISPWVGKEEALIGPSRWKTDVELRREQAAAHA